MRKLDFRLSSYNNCSDQSAHLRSLNKVCCLLLEILNSVECTPGIPTRPRRSTDNKYLIRQRQQRLIRQSGSTGFEADMQAVLDFFSVGICFKIHFTYYITLPHKF